MDVNVLFGVNGNFAIQPQPKLEGVELSEGMDVVIEGAERLFPTRPMIVMNGDTEGEQGGAGSEGERDDGASPQQ